MKHEIIDSDALVGKKIAFLVCDGFEQEELISPRNAVEEAVAETEIISPAHLTRSRLGPSGLVAALDVDIPLEHADSDDYDALVSSQRGGESRPSSPQHEGLGICAIVFQRRQAGGRNLSRARDFD